MKRSAPLKRKGKPRATSEERELRARWKAHTGRVCRVCPRGTCSGRVQGHHVVSQQALRRRGLASPRPLWDLRNKLDVCVTAHDLHTRAIVPIPFELVPAEALEFAREHDLLWWVERFYA